MGHARRKRGLKSAQNDSFSQAVGGGGEAATAWEPAGATPALTRSHSTEQRQAMQRRLWERESSPRALPADI